MLLYQFLLDEVVRHPEYRDVQGHGDENHYNDELQPRAISVLFVNV